MPYLFYDLIFNYEQDVNKIIEKPCNKISWESKMKGTGIEIDSYSKKFNLSSRSG